MRQRKRNQPYPLNVASSITLIGNDALITSVVTKTLYDSSTATCGRDVTESTYVELCYLFHLFLGDDTERNKCLWLIMQDAESRMQVKFTSVQCACACHFHVSGLSLDPWWVYVWLKAGNTRTLMVSDITTTKTFPFKCSNVQRLQIYDRFIA